MSNVNFR